MFTQVEAVVMEKYAELSSRLSPWHWTLNTGEVKISTAFLMECSPFNKHTYGDNRWHQVVGISPRHSLSIVTYAGATASDVVSFVEEIVAAIESIFNLTIESEVNIIFEK